MKVKELFNKLGFKLIRDWSDIGHKDSYTFEKIIWQNSYSKEYKEVYGCTITPTDIAWYQSMHYYKDSKIKSLAFADFFEILDEKDKKLIIMNLDLFSR